MGRFLRVLGRSFELRVVVVLAILSAAAIALTWYGGQRQAKEIRGELMLPALIADVGTEEMLLFQWSSSEFVIEAGDWPKRAVVCPASAIPNPPTEVKKITVSGSGPSEVSGGISGSSIYFDRDVLEVFDWDASDNGGLIEIDVAEGASVELVALPDSSARSGVTTRCVSVTLVVPESGQPLHTEHSGDLEIPPSVLPKVTLARGRGELSVGADSHAIDVHRTVDLEGDIFFSYSVGFVDVWGRADSVKFNGDEQLPPRSEILQTLQDHLVVIALTAIVTVTVGALLRRFFARNGSDR